MPHCCAVSCTTGERITNLREGLTKAEVIEMLGRPDGFQRSGDYEQLQYTNRIISGWSWDRADYLSNSEEMIGWWNTAPAQCDREIFFAEAHETFSS